MQMRSRNFKRPDEHKHL